MAGLCWMAVMLVIVLSTENSLAAVNQNRLANIVNGILREYRINSMFSLAVRVPDDQSREINDILKQVFQSDPVEDVRNTLNRDEVYIGSRVVAARVLKRTEGADHAESRVVGYLDHLLKRRNKNDHDLLLFYVYASPCVEKCTNNKHPENILQKINHIQKWDSYAFVFSKIFKPRFGTPNTEEELSGALQRLGSKIGLGNIFRCDGQDGKTQCISCSSNNQVTHACVSDRSGWQWKRRGLVQRLW
ncbi:uncharacterized protein si:dkey-96g2.1 [Chelmon rostratus]|uniref:uncharacterized protein si:dkey-96g2.1 n=1 Tax=Chelmon rostratus TaxID=109905 RepID=UPI001BE7EC14|nr:uncharacterized protein si:dkey-96g2.1 [Chelmon rostratus]XP_041789726.1 uncharacterized protein si:dkey-96g2.1 [Chelmon rostratus]